jgi:hypothetical protein
MAIPANVIMVWTGTNAAIPAGWARETTLDGKYPKATADGVNPNVTGGSNTHTHTGTTHGHTLNAHTHNVVLTHYSGESIFSNRNDNVADNHGHVSAAIGGTSGGSLVSAAISWQSVNQEPPYYEVIFVKPSGSAANIADDLCVFWNSATPPANFYHCDGDNATTDLRGKYLKGAAGAGDSGGTGGGTSHQHTVTHGHTGSGHTHSGTSGLRDNSGNRGNASVGAGAHQTHRHTITLNSTTANVSNYTNTTAGSGDTVEIAYKKLGIIQNTSGGSLAAKVGMIGMWLGTLANIPNNWQLCDGTNDTPDLRSKYIKIITTTAQLGDTGGSNTHTHTAVSHTHVATGTHTHSGSTGGATVVQNYDSGGDGGSKQIYTHLLTSVSSTTAVYANTNLDSGAAVSLEPAYRTVAYIQLMKIISGGFFAALMAS